ncbi:hypothetical protein XAP6164_810012 [Xanthomonas phaseoli pv. phaseoli]|nr:hypothetical protein XAP6164_2380013 [Xanthomonas phaseoli pv. phaseoli]SOO28370.1 hypothetical protein XAP6164_2380016 [Xanthomonas phaseoli pv. phaseoli]SOO29031.1 hypothetical protein XAP6164_3020014 [Xanthomonas phaseoli pv. phaseoli]SOO29206.1 hypothetical protein XAP6164_3120004 [Xanthomonas phaseoli pv. phaseoli]SOO29764.1 hypothetical protein XAP6164_3600021 [Xanthomonas phaseoli pv. phaseoli]
MSPRTHEVPDELLSSLLVNYTKPEDLIGENGPAQAADQAVGGAGAGRGDDRTPRS